jgi:hypothetical protein
MVVADILQNDRINISSKTTMPILENSKACTLVDLRDGQYTQVQVLNDSYGLIPSKEPACRIRNVTDNLMKVKINEEINFDSKSRNNKALVQSWSSPETWGTWSIGSESKINFKVIEQKNVNLWIEIEGTPFLNTNIEQTQVQFFSPLFDPVTYNFQKGDASIVLSIKLRENALIKTRGDFELFIKTPNNVSPRELGFSEDTRSLGFGIVSMRITDTKATGR